MTVRKVTVQRISLFHHTMSPKILSFNFTSGRIAADYTCRNSPMWSHWKYNKPWKSKRLNAALFLLAESYISLYYEQRQNKPE